MKVNTKQVVFLGLFIALDVIFSRVLSLNIGEIIRINFSFVIVALMAIYFGPVLAAIGNGISDFIGSILFPTGSYFPGFTVSAVIIGLIYGIILYKKHFSWWRVVVTQVLVLLVVTAGLNSIWLAMLLEKAYLILVIPRVTEGLLMIPIEVVVLGVVQKYMAPHFLKYRDMYYG